MTHAAGAVAPAQPAHLMGNNAIAPTCASASRPDSPRPVRVSSRRRGCVNANKGCLYAVLAFSTAAVVTSPYFLSTSTSTVGGMGMVDSTASQDAFDARGPASSAWDGTLPSHSDWRIAKEGEERNDSHRPSEGLLNFRNLSDNFPRFTRHDPIVPVYVVTQNLTGTGGGGVGGCIHRFHLSSPFSPSGRYLAVTCLPREDRPPKPGERAAVGVVDLLTGTQLIVAHTMGWDVQLGAQVQWGSTDRDLLFNDVDPKTWIPHGVRMDPESGERRKLGGTVYSVSPDGRWVASTCLRRIARTQSGYGVVVPDERVPTNVGAVDDDGVYVTNVGTGESRLVASYRRIVEEAVSPKMKGKGNKLPPGGYYGFHTKWNSAGDRILLVLRYAPKNKRKQRRNMLITMTPSGDDIRLAIPPNVWGRGGVGGNHPNWHPDGKHVLMNLNLDSKRGGGGGKGGELKFVAARYDGTDLHSMSNASGTPGHPSVHPGGKLLITDDYVRRKAARRDAPGGTQPLLLVDLGTGRVTTLVRMDSTNPSDVPGTSMRIDLHPAWDIATHTLVAINGVLDGTRTVFVADLSEFVVSRSKKARRRRWR